MCQFFVVDTSNSEVINAPLLHFKPIFDFSFKKIVREASSPMGGALVKIGHFLARVKIWKRSTFQVPKYGFPKNAT